MKTQILKRVFLLAGFALFGLQLFAQESFLISGKIVNSERQPMCNVMVTLLDANTMEIVATNECNEGGRFEIAIEKNGEYILCLKKPGFKRTKTHCIYINKKGKIIYNSEIVLENKEKHAIKKNVI